jgi:hypothetical protein
MIRTVVDHLLKYKVRSNTGFKYIFRIDNGNVVVFYKICCGNKAIRINGIIGIYDNVDAILVCA